mmetsp:Transcript_19666/g.53958  ORF Transcript_19666/g.53958 Transcript_19666/m.53958 type:complete len:200 (+) Transcript_19666:127-726(+)
MAVRSSMSCRVATAATSAHSAPPSNTFGWTPAFTSTALLCRRSRFSCDRSRVTLVWRHGELLLATRLKSLCMVVGARLPPTLQVAAPAQIPRDVVAASGCYLGAPRSYRRMASTPVLQDADWSHATLWPSQSLAAPMAKRTHQWLAVEASCGAGTPRLPGAPGVVLPRRSFLEWRRSVVSIPRPDAGEATGCPNHPPAL